MSVEAMAVVLHHSRAKGTAKLVLMGIANHEGDGGSWPSVNTLARYANVDPRNVQKALRTLEGLGEITTLRQSGGMADQDDVTRPNLYLVTLHCPGDCDGSTRHRTRESRLHYPTLPLDKTGGGSAPETGGEGLWTNPLTNSSPPDEIVTRGMAGSSPRGVTPPSPKPPTEPSSNQPTDTESSVTYGSQRAREDQPRSRLVCRKHPDAGRRGPGGPCSACWVDGIVSRIDRETDELEGAPSS